MKINKKNIRLAIKQLKENDIGADEYLSELFQEKKAILKAKKIDEQAYPFIKKLNKEDYLTLKALLSFKKEL